MWFKPRREEYEARVRGPMVALVADLLTLAAAGNLPLTGEPEKAVFRVYRDVRFAKDKRPYKTHCGASLSRTGAKLAPGLFYIHIEPGGCFVAAGFWHPEPALLERLRQRILAAPERFLKVARALDAKGMPIEPDDEGAKRLPRGCEAGRGTAVEPFLKHRNLIARTALSDADVGSTDSSDAAARSVRGGAAAAGFWVGRGRRLTKFRHDGGRAGTASGARLARIGKGSAGIPVGADWDPTSDEALDGVTSRILLGGNSRTADGPSGLIVAALRKRPRY